MRVVSKDGRVIGENAFIGQGNVAGAVYDASRVRKIVRLPMDNAERNVNAEILEPASDAIDEDLFTTT